MLSQIVYQNMKTKLKLRKSPQTKVLLMIYNTFLCGYPKSKMIRGSTLFFFFFLLLLLLFCFSLLLSSFLFSPALDM